MDSNRVSLYVTMVQNLMNVYRFLLHKITTLLPASLVYSLISLRKEIVQVLSGGCWGSSKHELIKVTVQNTGRSPKVQGNKSFYRK